MKTTNPTKIAFGMFRQQPLTNGHYRVYSEMLRDNDIVIIGLGSVQIKETRDNPFSESQRTEMIRKVFGKSNKIKIVPINDIGAVTKEEWVSHCLKRINDKKLPTPTRYYAGSETDLEWFRDSINLNGNPIELKNLERHSTTIMSGTLVRQSISTGTSEWVKHVPECLVDYINDNYPKHLLLSYHRNIR
jgi:citrate lyase synthetase